MQPLCSGYARFKDFTEGVVLTIKDVLQCYFPILAKSGNDLFFFSIKWANIFFFQFLRILKLSGSWF